MATLTQAENPITKIYFVGLRFEDQKKVIVLFVCNFLNFYVFPCKSFIEIALTGNRIHVNTDTI